jgi:hypothetical protein
VTKKRPQRPRLTRQLIDAMDSTLDDAVTNMCGCVGPGTGYDGHQRDCWVHLGRVKLKRIQKFIDDARAWLDSREAPEVNRLWLRLGDADDYHDFDDLDAVIEHLKEMGVRGPAQRAYGMFGVTAPGFEDHNHISLYWGPEVIAPVRSLSPDELKALNEALADSPEDHSEP